MSEEILEERVLIGNPIDGWERVVKKMQVKDTKGNKVIIQKGHGLTDISCEHGSRWIWNPLCISEPCWMQVVYAPGCDCGTPPNPYKIQVSRIKKPYFDAIVSGDKKEELKALSPYWVRRLIETENPPNVMKFVCGKRVHSRKITEIFKDKAKFIIGGVFGFDLTPCDSPIIVQWRIDLQLDKHSGYCIVVKLGEEAKP